MPALREELEVPVPTDRSPGRTWRQGTVVPAPRTERPVRIGYAKTTTARQELASQLEALRRAECHKIFTSRSAPASRVRPELEKALALAHQLKEAAPETPVILTVHELKRLARNAAELMTLSAELHPARTPQRPDHRHLRPRKHGRHVLRRVGVAGQIECSYIREKTLEGQVIDAAEGNHGGQPKVIDDDSLTSALALKDKGVPVPDIAKKLTIKTGRTRASPHPSPPLYRALAEAEQAAPDEGLPIRSKPVRIRHPDPLTPEETDLHERLQAQVLQRPEDE